MKYMEQARKGMSQLGNIEYCSDDDGFDPIDGMDSPGSCSQFDSPRSRNAPSVTTSSSFVSLSQHAKSIVGSSLLVEGAKMEGLDLVGGTHLRHLLPVHICHREKLLHLHPGDRRND